MGVDAVSRRGGSWRVVIYVVQGSRVPLFNLRVYCCSRQPLRLYGEFYTPFYASCCLRSAPFALVFRVDFKFIENSLGQIIENIQYAEKQLLNQRKFVYNWRIAANKDHSDNTIKKFNLIKYICELCDIFLDCSASVYRDYIKLKLFYKNVQFATEKYILIFPFFRRLWNTQKSGKHFQPKCKFNL